MQEPFEESPDAGGQQRPPLPDGTERAQALLGLANAALDIVKEEEDLDQVVQKVLDQATAMGAQEAAFFLVDENRRILRFVASSRPLPSELTQYIDGISIDDPERLLARVIATRQLYFAHQGELPANATEYLKNFMQGRGTLVLAPLLSRGRCIGLLGWTLAEKYHFNEKEREEVRRIAGILGVALDGRMIWERLRREVEERRQAEAEARESQAFLRRVIDHAPIGVALTRQSGALEFNEAARTILGITEPCTEEHCTLSSQVVREDGSVLPGEEIWDWLRRVGATGQDSFTIQRPDGTEVHVLRRVAPLYDDDGGPQGAVVIFQDVSSLREAERLRSQWTSLIVHDLRQPLTVISTTAGLLARQLGDSKLRAKATAIIASTKSLARMINDLTEVSRIEAHELKLDCAPVAPAAFTREVTERFEGEEDGRPFLLDTQPDLPLLQADPLRLEQVLWNLLSNAEKYGDPGTPVRIRVYRQGEQVCFSVQDEGPPIDPADLPRLFNRFFRAERVKRSRTGGFGLGLYIARGLVEAHGGSIWAESRGRQTTFIFTLPIPKTSREKSSAEKKNAS